MIEDWQRIAELEQRANERNVTIYAILHRNAGWGFQWAEKQGEDWKDGLVIYGYHPTLSEAIDFEFERFKKP